MNQISHKTEQEIKDFLVEIENNEISNFQYSNKIHHKINSIFKKFETFNSKHLSSNYMNIIILLNRLSFSNFCRTHAYIDRQYPGISFHYVMEAINEIKNNSIVPNYTRYNNMVLINPQEVFLKNECEVYLSRLRLLEKSNMLGLIVAPMRARLITGLLTDPLEESNNSILGPIVNNTVTAPELNNAINLPEVLDENRFLEILEIISDN